MDQRVAVEVARYGRCSVTRAEGPAFYVVTPGGVQGPFADQAMAAGVAQVAAAVYGVAR